MKKLVLILFVFTVQLTSAQSKDSVQIVDVLNRQLAAWNSGSIEGFMQGYWKSEELRFITKKGVTFGWNNVFESYKKSFSTKELMGKLLFNVDNVTEIAKNTYLTTGKWIVESADQPKSGYFSLVFKKVKNEWLIIVDHTF
jgi:CTP:phosphocholine cytidylyltransferase-like protein